MKKIAIIATLSTILVGCGPVQIEQYQEIKPSETAFVIALEGAAGDQVKFDSTAAVKNLRVSARRINIPTRKKMTGRMPWEFEYIPAVQVISIDRAPVTREWAQNDVSGGRNSDADAIYVESKESIAFSMAVTITCSIKEEEAHEFLYWYGGKSLSQVIDTNVRSVVASEMARQFGEMTLNECRETKGVVFDNIRKIIAEEFETKGITVLSFGNSGGLLYENSDVQMAMNREFITQNELRIAENKFAADEIVRKNTLAEAENERKKAEEFAKAQQAAEAQRKLAIASEAVAQWKGDVPQFLIVIGDTPLTDIISTKN